MTFTAQERSLLAQMADVLIPAGDGFPAASEAHVAQDGLDSVLSVRPELAGPLKELLNRAGVDVPAHLIRQLPQSDPEAFAALTECVAGAYFLNADVRLRLGYTGQEARPITPANDYLEDGMLQSVLDRGPIFRPTPSAVATPIPRPRGAIDRYDPAQSYDWNFEHAPSASTRTHPPVPGDWGYGGLPVGSPLAVAAGPLLNGRWILHYASLGFDILTYKTVRSSARRSYPMPNLQPVAAMIVNSSGSTTTTSEDMRGSWAVSFGMPSKSPEFWRADVEQTRKALAPGKILSVSVVATPEPDWTVDDVARDFARCAGWAVQSGADCIEANFSCPNVASADGQLYQRPDLAGRVAAEIRDTIGRHPLLLKIGHVTDATAAEELCEAVAPSASGLVMVNCIAATVADRRGKSLFNNEKRGIAGTAIRDAALDQVKLFRRAVQKKASHLRLIGVGGIAHLGDVLAHLAAGSQAVQLATAAMVNPAVGMEIRNGLAQLPRPS